MLLIHPCRFSQENGDTNTLEKRERETETETGFNLNTIVVVAHRKYIKTYKDIVCLFFPLVWKMERKVKGDVNS